MSEINKYQHEIDCIKGLSCLIVILRHTKVSWYADWGNFPDLWFNSWGLFAVPIFFFISGFTLTLNYKDKLEPKTFYKKRFKTLIPLYLIWSFLYVIIIGLSKRQSHEILESIKKIFYGDVTTYWYIFAVFQFYLLYPLILKLFKKLSFTLRQAVIIIILILMLSCYLLGEKFVNSIFLIQFFIPWVIYFVIGMDIAFYWEETKTILKNNVYIKILITCLFLISYAALPYFITSSFPFKPAPWILTNIITIFFLLMVFNQRRIYVTLLKSEEPFKKGILVSNSNDAKYQFNFEGRFFGYISRFFWINGQYALGLYITHRVFMQLIAYTVFNFLGIDILPWKRNTSWTETVSRFEGFWVSVLFFILVYIAALIFISLMWKIPKTSFIIGKKSRWISIERKEVVRTIKDNKNLQLKKK